MADNPEAASENAEITPLRVFIAGGTTGVGFVLARQLTALGMRVTATTDQGSRGAYALRAVGALPVYPDLTRTRALYSVLTMAQADVVINAAPQVVNGLPQQPRPWRADAESIEKGTQALVEAAGQAGVKRIIHLSMASAYGDRGGATITEETALSQGNPLYQAVARAEAAALDGAIPAYVLRAGYVYGGHSEASKSIYDQMTVSRAVKKGAGVAGWIHEDDLAGVVRLLVEKPFAEDEPLETIYNVVDGQPATPDQFIMALGEAMGIGQPQMSGFGFSLRSPDPIWLGLLNDAAIPDGSKVRTDLAWTPRYADRSAGIEAMMRTWRAAEAPPEPAALPEPTTSDKLALPS